MSILRRLLAGLALILAVGACENDDPGLTMEESVALLGAAAGMVSDTTIVPIYVSETMDTIVFACPGGGQAQLVGGLIEPGDEPGDTARLGADFQITPTGCGVTGGGMAFTLDGNPNFVYILTLEIVPPFEVNISGSIVGGLSWALGDRSGDCDIALTLEAEPDLSDPTTPGLNGAYKGTLCGHEVEIDANDLVVGL